MEPIAHIRTDFASKFGVPRQAGAFCREHVYHAFC